MKTSEKWKYCESIPLWYQLITYDCMPLCNMDNKMVSNEK